MTCSKLGCVFCFMFRLRVLLCSCSVLVLVFVKLYCSCMFKLFLFLWCRLLFFWCRVECSCDAEWRVQVLSSSLLYSSVTRVEECDESCRRNVCVCSYVVSRVSCILFCLSWVCPSLVVLCHKWQNVVSLVVLCHMSCSVVSWVESCSLYNISLCIRFLSHTHLSFSLSQRSSLILNKQINSSPFTWSSPS